MASPTGRTRRPRPWRLKKKQLPREKCFPFRSQLLYVKPPAFLLSFLRGGKLCIYQQYEGPQNKKPNPTQPSEASSPLKAPGHHPFPVPATRASPCSHQPLLRPRGFTHFPESPANSALTQFLGVWFGLFFGLMKRI